MGENGAILEAAGYALAALAYGLLVVLTLASFRRRLRSGYLAAALLTMAVWALVYTLGATVLSLDPLAVFILESVVDLVWLVFLASLLAGAVSTSTSTAIRFGGVGLAAGVVVVGLLLEFRPGVGAAGILVPAQILTSLAVLVAVEQVFRNARPAQRRGLKYLCLYIATLFAFDLVLYSTAVATGTLVAELWIARGFVAAAALPLVVVALSRSPVWGGGIFVSRQIVFHSATIVATGLYLTVIGVAGGYLKDSGAPWSSVFRVAFIALSIVAFLTVLLSERARGSVRVFLDKHFFESKYDYRSEWLRLIGTLTDTHDGLPLSKRALKALTDILDSESGVLWLKDAHEPRLVPVAGWNRSVEGLAAEEAADVVRFFEESGWIVSLPEYRQHPKRYPAQGLDFSSFSVEGNGIIVPLLHDTDLIGLACLESADRAERLTYEDLDLLKTAGKQVASYLSQEQATEELAQNRQFEAFNRLTAYLMHDLKNVIAQHSLVVENAQKHADNPAFIADAIETIRGGVVRMRRVIDQLRQSTVRSGSERVELGAAVMKAVSLCEDRSPQPRAELPSERMWVRGDSEQLQMAIYHAIRNAQDATAEDGSVRVTVESENDAFRTRIVDTGTGMDAEFVRERLFRPFDSTKGSKGMGIGAHQIRSAIEAMGGRVRVDSTPGQGTCFSIDLPQEDALANSARAGT